MPKMTLFWLILYVTGTIASFINPIFGTVTYLFEYYLRPSLHWWGKELPDLRWNFTIAAVLTFTYLMRRQSQPPIVDARRGPGTCLVALLCLMLLISPFAVSTEKSLEATTRYGKMILFHGLVVGTVRTELAFDAFVAMHMAGAGWWGWETFRNPKRESGRLANVGSGDTLGDNAAAAHLLTVLPFVAVYLLMHKDKRLRWLALIVAPLIVNAFILCNSRGGVVAMIVAGAATLFLTKSGYRFRTIVVGIIGLFALFALADPEFIERQQTTTKYEEDGSAMERLESWRGGVRLVQDHPFGTGGSGYTLLSPVYAPGVVAANGGDLRDPHNTIVLVAAEWGLLGLGIYLAYYASCARLLAEVRKRATEGGIWYYRSVAIQVAMIGVFVAGAFSDRLYAEAPYWMGALAVALHRLQTDKLQREGGLQPAVAEGDAQRGNARRPYAARTPTGYEPAAAGSRFTAQ